ncbi:hypothetical protein [Streptomyces sp. CBMA156]|uniref:hypothetical protein n=1 Tax=Streptomyces sp. CBMA156 TaxID=1930280 RepID=UPI00166198F8|nr:hypothetical protein [Streptomyces sp. CBMA156]MBD0676643.1 hypothetical protein [Streptomyces sp. CBMA156]
MPTTCFVIGPAGDRYPGTDTGRASGEAHLRVFEQVVRPACAALGIEPLHTDDARKGGEASDRICRHVLQSDIVIADLTDGEPDVLYQLGLRHTTGRPTVHLAERGRLPFDASPGRTILYERSPDGLADARERLRTALDRVLTEGYSPLPPARILLGLRSRDHDAALGPPGSDQEDREDRAGPERREEPEHREHQADQEDGPGLIDRFAAVEAEMRIVTQGIETMTDLVNTIANLAEDFGPVPQAPAGTGSAPAATAPAALRGLAVSLAGPASELRDRAAEVASRVSGVDPTVHRSLALFEAAPHLWEGSPAHDSLLRLVGMSHSAWEVLKTLRLFRMTMEWLLSARPGLQGPAEDIIAALDRLTETMARIESWDRRARALV